jgi:hypothetical protein
LPVVGKPSLRQTITTPIKTFYFNNPVAPEKVKRAVQKKPYLLHYELKKLIKPYLLHYLKWALPGKD